MSPNNLFSLSIFFVVFREVLHTALIISVLLSLVDQVFHHPDHTTTPQASLTTDTAIATVPVDPESEPTPVTPRLLRKLKLQIVFGGLVGLAIAVAIGTAYIAIWFTQARDLWAPSEQLWEGIPQLAASLMIFAIGIAMVKMESTRTKWRIKLRNAFNSQQHDRGAKTGKWVLFILPMITVLREGLEGVVFVGGVSLSQPATSIPIAAIVGISCGILCGIVVYQFASRATFRIFLICMTNLLLLIGAGLFSKAVWAFQENTFLHLIGGSSDDPGSTGPGSYDVRGNVWHLNCCSSGSGSWSVFNAVFGWENSATLGSVLSYISYWLAVIVALVYIKFKEGHTTIFGWESANGKRRRQRREAQKPGQDGTESPAEKDSQAGVDVDSQAGTPPESFKL